jgi:hypothetical protein
MKTLVFVLVLQTFNNGYLENTENIAYWYNLNTCIWYATTLSNQSEKKYSIPIMAFCKPVYIDDKEIEVF